MRMTRRASARIAALVTGLIATGGAVAGLAAGASAGTGAPAPAPAVPTCQAATLSLRLLGTDTGVGSTAMTIAITNHSDAACDLSGYPSVRLQSRHGTALPVTVRPGRGGLFGGLTAGPRRLGPGGQASFFLFYRGAGTATGRLGVPATALQVTLPAGSGTFIVPAMLAPAGTVLVSPVRAGAREE